MRNARTFAAIAARGRCYALCDPTHRRGPASVADGFFQQQGELTRCGNSAAVQSCAVRTRSLVLGSESGSVPMRYDRWIGALSSRKTGAFEEYGTAEACGDHGSFRLGVNTSGALGRGQQTTSLWIANQSREWSDGTSVADGAALGGYTCGVRSGQCAAGATASPPHRTGR